MSEERTLSEEEEEEERRRTEKSLFEDSSDDDEGKNSLVMDDDAGEDEDRKKKTTKNKGKEEEEEEEDQKQKKKSKNKKKGSDDESEGDDEEGQSRSRLDESQMNDEELDSFNNLLQKESDDEDEPVMMGHMDLEYYEVPRPPKNLYLVKLPNFLGIDTRPFDPDTHLFEDDNEEIDEEGKKVIRPTSETTIRWRFVRDENGNILTDEKGIPQMESNARLVRWADGTTNLILGGNEFLNATFEPIHGRLEKKPKNASSSSNSISKEDEAPSLTHLFALSRGNICHAQPKKKLVLTPFSLKSKVHKKLALSVLEKHKEEGRKVMLCVTERDPEKEKEQRERAEAERNKNLGMAKRLQSMQRKKQERLSASYLEDDDLQMSDARGRKRERDEAEDTQRLMRAKQMDASRASRLPQPIKTKAKRPAARRPTRDEDEEEEGDEDFITEEVEFEEEDENEEDEDDEDDEENEDEERDDDVKIFDEDDE
eukprot:TRINITY_DN9919_c0_g6_i1.p1 TRINITY_DN9919_c0_g6~~TRINITY_DN9919_c0_g6_i1.p1  ORF type:complete len:483 (-),score=231.52 TRINITY_DN9919_c0_g6_i1:39-1487(-)